MNQIKITDPHDLHLISLTVIDRGDLFIRKSHKELLMESIEFCRKEKGLAVCAYVFTSNYVHLIAEAKGEIPLSDILRDFKKCMARKILNEIEHGGHKNRWEWMLHRLAYRGQESPGNRQ